MATINNITPIPVHTEATRAVSRAEAAAPVVPRVEAPKLDQAVLSTSSSYREFQAELIRKLEGAGFTAEQSLKLTQVGNLSVRQFTRATVLGQLLMHDPGAFDDFVGTLKNVVNRGKNVQDGVRAFMGGVDRLLGSDSRAVTEEILKNRNPEIEAATRRNYSPHPGSGEAKDAERQFAGSADLVAMLPARRVLADARDAAELSEYVRFFNNSMEEFPTRFHVDAYAQNELARKGLPLKDYVKLAGEIPPLRLLNLLVKAGRAGQLPEAVLKTFLAAYENGEDLNAVLGAMERSYGTGTTVPGAEPVPQEFPLRADFSGASGPVPRENEAGTVVARAPTALTDAPTLAAIPSGVRRMLAIPGATVEIIQGDSAVVEFLAMEAKDGVIPSDRTAAMIFPQRVEIPGQSLNLSYLPVGAYMVLFAGVDPAGRLMNLWMKVIVREREDEDEDEDDRLAGGGGAAGEGASDKPPRKNPPEEFLKPDFSGAEPILAGPFLGEIVLPLDFLSRDPGELAVVTPGTGVVVSREEYERGVFPHYAVTFRFLANHVTAGEPMRRHAPLGLAPSAAFEQFDALMTRFMKDPRAERASFDRGMEEFFAGLAKSFPAGEKTFATAREVFSREAAAYAEGLSAGAGYDAASIEKNGERFVAACYAKGACALASAGDAAGALGGFARSALTDLGNASRKSELGEYLRGLGDIRYAREKAESVREAYATRVGHGADGSVTDGDTEDLGGRFLQAVVLKRPGVPQS